MRQDPDPRILRNVERMRQQGASVEEVEAYLQGEGLRPVERAPPEASGAAQLPGITVRGQRPSGIGGALRTAFQGASFGFGDELEGVARGVGAWATGGDPIEAFSRGVDEARGSVEGFRGAHPRAGLALEVAGGLAGGGVGALRSAGSAVGRTAIRRAVGSNLAQGAAAGVASGAGAAEGGIGDRVGGAAAGGIIGGLTGGLVSGVSAIRGPAARARGVVSRVVERGGVTDLPAAVASAAPEETLIDIGGKSVAKLARGAESIPSRGAEDIHAALVQRSENAPSRIQAELQSATGLSYEDAVQTANDLFNNRRAAAGPLYQAAFARGPVNDPAILELIRTKPSLQLAYQRAVATAAEEGAPLAPLNAPDVRTLHMVKEELDDLIRRANRSAETSAPSARNTRAMVETKNALLAQLEAAVPEYGAARRQFAGDSAVMDAFDAAMEGNRDMGLQAFIREDPRRIQQALNAMSPSEQEFYRRGALDSVRQMLENTADGRDLSKVISRSSGMRDRVRQLFTDDVSYQRFVDSMSRERGMFDRGQFVLGGSGTSRIDAERADLLGMQFTADDVKNPISSLGARALNRGLGHWQVRGGEATVNELAPMLTASGDELKALVDGLMQFRLREEARKRLTAGASRTAAIPLGLGIGRASVSPEQEY